LPPIADFVPGYEASQWYGLAAAKDTPADVVARLNKEVIAALADSATKARLADFGGTPFPGSPADFGDLIVKETDKWAKVVKATGATAE
jgi:tripartite-type tricarboxylate transporter receptor subunit TctC